MWGQPPSAVRRRGCIAPLVSAADRRNVPEGTHRRFVKVFLKEHLWKSGKKRQHGNRIRMMDLGTIAEIPAASVVKKPRQKRALEV
jgi:hypothetical protein